MFGFKLAECASGAGSLRERVQEEGWNAFDVYAAGASGPRAMASMGWVWAPCPAMLHGWQA